MILQQVLGGAVSNDDETLAMQTERGNELVLSGEYGDIRVVFLGTERDLAVTL